VQGIDLAARGRFKNKNKQNSRSKNLYHNLLVKVRIKNTPLSCNFGVLTFYFDAVVIQIPLTQN
jgi:hypothetical protein